MLCLRTGRDHGYAGVRRSPEHFTFTFTFQNSYSVATHPIPNAPITCDEGLIAAGYRHYYLALAQTCGVAFPACNNGPPVALGGVCGNVGAGRRGGGGQDETKPSSLANWRPEDPERVLVAQLKERIRVLKCLVPLCTKLIDSWNTSPWKGYQIPHSPWHGCDDCAHLVPPQQVLASVFQVARRVSLHQPLGHHCLAVEECYCAPRLSGPTRACWPGQTLFIVFVPYVLCGHMMTLKREALTELMHSV